MVIVCADCRRKKRTSFWHCRTPLPLGLTTRDHSSFSVISLATAPSHLSRDAPCQTVPNIFPATSRSQAHPQSLDPIGKLQREDALSYINQYVLPKLDFGVRTDGMPKRATVRQDAAAASLNSLAPYFYGPDAAAGVGIYSATDGKDFTPASGSAFGQLEDGGPRGPGGPGVSGMPLMSVEDAEAALSSARKETDKLEKKLNNLIKSNRRVLLGGAR